MSTPVASPADLELYLGEPVGSIDVDRANLILQMAQDLCETVVTPLPVTARAVVMAVAARAYTNVSSATQLGMGSAYATLANTGTGGAGGMYLSRSDKAALRALAGRGSAFSADTMPPGVNAVQTVTVSASSGTFTLTFNGATTAGLAFDASAAAVQAAVEGLSSVGAGNVTVASPAVGVYAVTFTGSLRTNPMPPLTGDGSGLAGGTVAVAQTVVGVQAPGQNLPPWSFDYYQQSGSLGSRFYGGV
jgi:hypothetical protein